jgi:hypothetical protein
MEKLGTRLMAYTKTAKTLLQYAGNGEAFVTLIGT